MDKAVTPCEPNKKWNPRPWILGSDFGDSGVAFSFVMAHRGVSGLQKSILEVLTDLCAQNEKSRAGQRPIFGSLLLEVQRILELLHFQLQEIGS